MRGRTLIYCGLMLFLLASAKISFAEDAKEEMSLGFHADREFVSKNTILYNERLQKRISEIGNRVAKFSDKPDVKYIFRINNNPVINAYATTGGFVYINTGLLDILETEDELAAVIAHEIAHLNKKHLINFLYTAHRKKVTGQIAGSVLGATFATVGAIGVYAMPVPSDSFRNAIYDKIVFDRAIKGGEEIGNAMTISMIKGYGREQELEADACAVKYIHKAGYDPYAFIGFFKKLISVRDRLAINNDNYVSCLINADPGLEERAGNAEQLIQNPDENKKIENKK